MKRNPCSKVMTILVICIIGAIVCVSAKNSYICKRTDNIVNDSPYSELLPENIRSTILSTDSMTWILVDPWIYNDSIDSTWGEHFGEILSIKTTACTDINESIQDLLLSPDSFQNDSIVKESVFMPDFGVIFKNSSDTVIVSYSLYCDICRFQTAERILDLNGEGIRNSFILNLKKVFPKDKFVRNISKRL